MPLPPDHSEHLQQIADNVALETNIPSSLELAGLRAIRSEISVLVDDLNTYKNIEEHKKADALEAGVKYITQVINNSTTE